MRSVVLAAVLLAFVPSLRAVIPDSPFWQDIAVRIQTAPDLTNAVLRKLCIDRDGIVYVLTDRGVARVYDQILAIDRSFRPLRSKTPVDITTSPSGKLYYLFDDHWLSNADNGLPLGTFPAGQYTSIAVGADGVVWLAGPGRLAAHGNGQLRSIPVPPNLKNWKLLADETGFFFWAENQLGAFLPATGSAWDRTVPDVQALAVRGAEVFVGTPAGFFGLKSAGAEPATPLQDKLPWPDVTCLKTHPQGVWVGTRRGLFYMEMPAVTVLGMPADAALPLSGETVFRYYASRRWLPDDEVLDIALEPSGHVWALTKGGLGKIEFRRMTLAQKAEWFQNKIRSRHIRMGLTAERRMEVPGDITTGEMIDTDNDGGWSSYYLASQALRHAVTGSDEARRHAWETLGALERLETINGLDGFPSRSFERARRHYVSDPERWHPSPDPHWDWKAHTSSDEIASHTLAYALMWDHVAKNDSEKERIRRLVDRIASHILRNNLRLIDVDGKPTLWGRWDPEYLNAMPHSVFDRRLNSSEVVALFQLAHKLTGRTEYRQTIHELFTRHGYLTNIVSSMKAIAPTRGVVHMGHNLGDEWNHSDDELAFVTYWVLTRFAIQDDWKTQFTASVADHWAFERDERYPLWNFIAAACGIPDHDALGAVWTLRGWPMDTIRWRVENSHRKDLTHLPRNFMGRELKELLPPGERPIVRCNEQPFLLDGGDGGRTELPGDEFLFGYWLGRFVGDIGPAD